MYGVHKDFNGEIEALSDINLQVEKRDFVFLVGPSGAESRRFCRFSTGELFPPKDRYTCVART